MKSLPMQEEAGAKAPDTDTADRPAVMAKASSEELHRREKLAVQSVYGHVDAFVNFPCAQNYDYLSLALREMQTAWMNGRKRVME